MKLTNFKVIGGEDLCVKEPLVLPGRRERFVLGAISSRSVLAPRFSRVIAQRYDQNPGQRHGASSQIRSLDS